MRKFYRLSGLREFLKLNGIDKLSQALDYLFWTCLKGQKQQQ